MSTAKIMFCSGRFTPFLVLFLGVFKTSEESITEIDLRDVLSAVISSPNFPNSYPPGTDCAWTVIAPDDYRIKVKFKAFQLGECGSRNCNTSFDCDVLEISDGARNSSALIGRFCASQRPPGFYSKGNLLWIRFKSCSRPNNGSVGFEATFSTENMVLAFLLPILGCILLLFIIIAVVVIIKCRRQKVTARNSSDRLSRSDTDILPMGNRPNMEEQFSWSEQQEHSMPLLFRDSEESL
ncbi:Bone morphogenetic protein 1 [Desmophyllum pertusum]|uniref:Bone morphogenetic protein 1 n=1 Tax=Desmophyllum pertusum TaxID=174260 RepID=A0A9X0DA96_9CNID|nr:Bone morphogenetic protein 1 [Desmophyllum pertusum]